MRKAFMQGTPEQRRKLSDAEAAEMLTRTKWLLERHKQKDVARMLGFYSETGPHSVKKNEGRTHLFHLEKARALTPDPEGPEPAEEDTSPAPPSGDGLDRFRELLMAAAEEVELVACSKAGWLKGAYMMWRERVVAIVDETMESGA